MNELKNTNFLPAETMGDIKDLIKIMAKKTCFYAVAILIIVAFVPLIKSALEKNEKRKTEKLKKIQNLQGKEGLNIGENVVFDENAIINDILIIEENLKNEEAFKEESLKQDESYEKSSAKDLEKILGYIFIVFWVCLFLLSLSLFNYKNLFNYLFSTKFAIAFVSIIALILCEFVGIFILIVFLFFTQANVIFILIICAIFIFSFVFANLANIDKKLKKFPRGVFDFGLTPLITKSEKVKKAFNSVNSKIGSLYPDILYPALIFTIQWASISVILNGITARFIYLAPLMFLLNWSFNYCSLFNIYKSYLILDRDNYKDLKGKAVTKKELIEIHFYICNQSFQKTLISFLYLFPNFYEKWLSSHFKVNSKILTTLKKLENVIKLSFHLKEISSDMLLFQTVLIKNKILNAELNINDPLFVDIPEHVTEITIKTFKKEGFLMEIILSPQNCLIYAILNLNVIIHYLLSYNSVEASNVTYFEDAGSILVTFVKSFNFNSFIGLLGFMLLINYMTTVRSAYLLNKKNEIDELEEQTKFAMGIKFLKSGIEKFTKIPLVSQGIDVMNSIKDRIANIFGLKQNETTLEFIEFD